MPATFFFPGAANVPFSQEACIVAFEPSRPYPQNPYAIIYRARFQQLRAYYTKPAPNTPHPNLPQVYFSDDVDFQDKMSGLVEWTRIYCTLPTSWNDFGSDAYTFPGLSGIRVPVTKTVTQKIVQDYYLVGTLPIFDNLIVSYDNWNAVDWTKSGVTTAPNAALIPAAAGGVNAAASITDDGSTGIHSIYQGGGLTGAKPVAVFLKNGNANVACVALIASASPNYTTAFATVDLRTGLVLTNGGAVPSVAAIGDGWWRIALTNAASVAAAGVAVVICDDNGNTSYVGTGRYLYGWRGQVAANVTTFPHATVPPTTTPDATNYPVPNADSIIVKFGLQYNYTWALNAAAEYLDGSTGPSISTYNNYVLTDQNVANTNIFSIESTDSTLSLWQGSVWLRARHFVKAR